jgi:O-antigen ligase
VAPSRALPWDLLLVAAAALILISVGRLHSFIPGAGALRPALLAAVLAVPALILNHRGARQIKLLRTRLGYAMGFIFLWAAIGAPFALYPGYAVRSFLEGFLRTGIIVLVIAASVRNVRDVERLLRVFALGAIAFAMLGTGQGFRVFGGGGYDPNDAAMFVVSAIPVVVYFLVRSKSVLWKLVFGFGVLTCVSAVVLSGSRGGYLALAAVIAFVLIGFRGIKLPVRAGVVAILAGAVTFSATGDFWERLESINDPDDYNRHSPGGRVNVWKRGIGYMAASPIVGVGLSNFRVAEGQHPSIAQDIADGRGRKYSAAHSIWVQIGADLGVPGLVAFLLMFGMATRLLWTTDRLAGGLRARGDPDVKAVSEMGRPLIGVLLAVAVAGSFLSHAYMATVWMPFALVLGLQKVLYLRNRQVARARVQPAMAVAAPGSWPRPVRDH